MELCGIILQSDAGGVKFGIILQSVRSTVIRSYITIIAIFLKVFVAILSEMWYNIFSS